MMPSNDIFAHESKCEQRQTHDYAQRNSVKAQYRCPTGSRHHDIPKEQIGVPKSLATQLSLPEGDSAMQLSYFLLVGTIAIHFSRTSSDVKRQTVK